LDIVSIRSGFDARALVLIERKERGWRLVEIELRREAGAAAVGGRVAA
jgi:hypothetical protein